MSSLPLPAIGDQLGFFFRVRNGAETDRPVMFHRVDSGFGGGQDVHAMRDHRETEPVGLIDNGF